MRMIGPQTIRRYENFKQQIFGKKKDSFKQKMKNQTKKPATKLSYSNNPSSHPFFKKITFITLFSIGFYIANQKFHLIHQAVTYLDSLQINPITKATIVSLYSDFSRRLSFKSQQRTLNQRTNTHFANICFINQLKFHLSSLQQKNVPRILSQQISSRYRFGPFRFGCKYNRLYVNNEGNLIRQSKYSKLNIGNLGVFGSKIEEIIQYENNVELFSKSQQVKMQDSCQKINILNYCFEKSEDYQKVYSQCVDNSNIIYNRIKQKVKNQKKKYENGNVKSNYFFSFS